MIRFQRSHLPSLVQEYAWGLLSGAKTESRVKSAAFQAFGRMVAAEHPQTEVQLLNQPVCNPISEFQYRVLFVRILFVRLLFVKLTGKHIYFVVSVEGLESSIWV